MHNEQHWRDRAEEARTIAESMCSDETRCQMLEIAKGYDRMAEHAIKLAADAERFRHLDLA